MLAGHPAVAADRVAVHPAEPAGLADAAALGDVLQDRFDLLGREPGVEQGRALAPRPRPIRVPRLVLIRRQQPHPGGRQSVAQRRVPVPPVADAGLTGGGPSRSSTARSAARAGAGS